MRDRLTAVAAGALLFVAACGGGNSGSGNSGATGGTTGASTTGGATTGAALPSGQPCTANAQCASDVCGLHGTGNCCMAACSTTDSACGATGCDADGTCIYADAGTSCGNFCGANEFTPKSCDGAGKCATGTPTSCSGNFGCNSAGTACNTSCGDSTACAGGYVCNDGGCTAPRTIGPCTENDDCFSLHCGIRGVGNCCVGSDAGCLTGDATCGATDCSPSNGQCNYPDAGTTCGSVLASCSNNIQQNPSICDGKGTCPAPATVPCDAFICGPHACLTSCTDDTSCGTGDFCDVSHQTCCESLPSGSTITVDATSGTDDACCSIAGHAPCQTLHQAMTIIDDARAQNVTLKALVLKGHTWNPQNETYPIILGWGAELAAPGIDFYDPTPDGGTQVIDIDNFSANDTVGYASIVGAAGNDVTIGLDEFGDQALDHSMIQVESGNTLYVANASINGSYQVKVGLNQVDTETTAITVAGGGSMTLGQDKSAAVTGTVTIGNSGDNELTNGWNGIVCGTANGKGCTITDATLKAGVSSVVIEGQENIDIDAEDNAKITLTSNPVIGLSPTDAGFQECPDKPDVEEGLNANNPSNNGAAVLLNGSASVTFDNGTVQCIAGDAFDLFATKSGTPTLSLTNTTIQNTEYGVNAFAGSATISDSTIWYNASGVQQGTDGTHVSSLDLSSGGDGGMTTVVCSNSYESFRGTSTVGVSVLNSTSANLDAANVDWDTSGPDLFSCDSTLEDCTCELSSCTLDVSDGGVDGMDAVYTAGGTIDTTGNGLSTADCTAPAHGGGNCCNSCPPVDCCEEIIDPPAPPICECIPPGGGICD